MTMWVVFAGVLAVGGLGPALWVGARHSGVARLVGMQSTSSVTVLLLIALSAAFGQSSYLIVPLVLVVLGYAGTLVYTRLLSE
jgi:multisubunit Na+/H+ antiporter MnhF subunit